MGENMKNKTLTIIVILMMALLTSLPYWLDAVYNDDNGGFLYTAIFFWAVLAAFICSAVFLIIKVKKISEKVWLMLLITLPLIGVFVSRNFDSGTFRIENKLAGIFSEPIMWMLIATLIGHFILFIYKRNKPQIS